MFHPLKTRDAGGKVMLVKPHFLTLWLFLLPRRGWVSLQVTELTDGRFSCPTPQVFCTDTGRKG